MLEGQAPWSYTRRAAELMRGAGSLLDMGTGGGERLLKMRDSWPQKVVVTEDYPPNIRLAKERLNPLGVQVVEVSLPRTGAMPFQDGEFDLVLNRHSGCNPAEVARILTPGGAFLTQQVNGLNVQDLLAEFGASPKWPDSTPELYLPLLAAAGMQVVDCQEWQGEIEFTDVGAIVYYLKAVPWLVEGFSVDTHQGDLLCLQRRLEAGDRLVFTERRYMIEARKR
jgi:SAM-dependent methyltransferase